MRNLNTRLIVIVFIVVLAVWIDFSKGLGAPIGAVIAGTDTFIDEVWRWKQRLGGAMRQAGLVAAAGLYALDHHMARLGEDHANAEDQSAGQRADHAAHVGRALGFDGLFGRLGDGPVRRTGRRQRGRLRDRGQ